MYCYVERASIPLTFLDWKSERLYEQIRMPHIWVRMTLTHISMQMDEFICHINLFGSHLFLVAVTSSFQWVWTVPFPCDIVSDAFSFDWTNSTQFDMRNFLDICVRFSALSHFRTTSRKQFHFSCFGHLCKYILLSHYHDYIRNWPVYNSMFNCDKESTICHFPHGGHSNRIFHCCFRCHEHHYLETLYFVFACI